MEHVMRLYANAILLGLIRTCVKLVTIVVGVSVRRAPPSYRIFGTAFGFYQLSREDAFLLVGEGIIQNLEKVFFTTNFKHFYECYCFHGSQGIVASILACRTESQNLPRCFEVLLFSIRYPRRMRGPA